MKYEGSRTGRLEIAQVPLFEWCDNEQRFKAIDDDRPSLPCSNWCRICVDIERNIEMNPSMTEDGRDPCSICPDCSDTPEWTI